MAIFKTSVSSTDASLIHSPRVFSTPCRLLNYVTLRFTVTRNWIILVNINKPGWPAREQTVSGEAPSENLTQLLVDWSNGDAEALQKLTPLVYGDLRRLAARYLRSELPNHTLQSTALVHEAYLRLIDQRNIRWQNRAHFFGISAQLIRRILVDYARARKAGKRGGQAARIQVDESIAAPEEQNLDLVVLDDCLKLLSTIDPQQARVIELRYFAGLTVEETAEVMHVSPTTVKREWRLAKAWLHREIGRSK